MLPIPDLNWLHTQSLEVASVKKGIEGLQIHIQKSAENVEVFEDEPRKLIVWHLC